MGVKIKVYRNNDIAATIRYVGFRLFTFLVIAGLGIGGMYFADNYYHMMAVGVVYLIVMTAIIVVILIDQLDHEVLKKLRGKG